MSDTGTHGMHGQEGHVAPATSHKARQVAFGVMMLLLRVLRSHEAICPYGASGEVGPGALVRSARNFS